jgi:PAS domain S-box-containing protein
MSRTSSAELLKRMATASAGAAPAAAGPRDGKPAAVERRPRRGAAPAPRRKLGRDAAAQHLAAIVESSEDAIVTKDLNGIVTSWNKGAERLFGYRPREMIGKPITLLVPDDRRDEEAEILSQLRRGRRIRHYETVRRRKNGDLVDVSLSVSPLRDAQGRIYGAAKIARDISDRKQMEARQALLIREMNHRIKNIFAIASSIIHLTATRAQSLDHMVANVQERLALLARVHALSMPQLDPAEPAEVSLHQLIQMIYAPYCDHDGIGHCRVSGVDIALGSGALTSLALLFFEFATNASKYGALSSLAGSLDIECAEDGEWLTIDWRESGGPKVGVPAREGFGTALSRITVERHLAGTLERDWQPHGLTISLRLLREKLAH